MKLTISKSEDISPCILEINNIILKADVAADVYACFLLYKIESHIDAVINQSEFFGHTALLNLRTAILELSKLFPAEGSNDDHNHYAFRRIIKEVKLLHIVPNDKFQPVELLIKTIENQPSDGINGIEGIPDYEKKLSKAELLKLWRHKFIAHTDKKRFDRFSQMGLPLILLKEMVVDAIYIINTISGILPNNGSSYENTNSIVENLQTILDKLAEIKE